MSGARADTNPSTNAPVGPTRTQPGWCFSVLLSCLTAADQLLTYYRDQQPEGVCRAVRYVIAIISSSFSDNRLYRLNVSQQIPLGATKGEASDVISAALDKQSGGAGSGAAKDTTPG